MVPEGLLVTATKEFLETTALPMAVRPSVESDVPAMLAIYEHHVRHGQSELDAEFMAPDPLRDDDIKRRRKNMLRRRLPHLVAERGGAVVGYAYAAPFRKRPAYRYAVKHSIYVHPGHLHSGIGRALLPAPSNPAPRKASARCSPTSMPATWHPVIFTRRSTSGWSAFSKVSD